MAPLIVLPVLVVNPRQRRRPTRRCACMSPLIRPMTDADAVLTLLVVTIDGARPERRGLNPY